MRYAVMSTPLGPLTLASTPKGLASLHFGKNIPRERNRRRRLQPRYSFDEIEEYFQGERTQFDFPLDFTGTPFQVAVWRELLKIPYGETRTYGEIARRLGKPGASRAVGMANHENRIAIVIPCHRVIGHNGSLTGYAGGIHLKQQLLSLERNQRHFSHDPLSTARGSSKLQMRVSFDYTTTMPKNEKLDTKRHSLAHIMAASIQEMFPEAKFGVGPVIEDGFYYDVYLSRPLTPEDLQAIEKRMRDKVKQNLRFERSEMPMDTATDMFGKMSQDFKVELLRDLKTRGTTAVADLGDSNLVGGSVTDVSVYKTGNFTDLCRGPHVGCDERNRSGEFPADARIRRLLARQPAARADAARVRRRIRYEEGTRGVFRPSRRGEETRSPQARPGTGPLHVSPVGAGRCVLAAEGHDALQHARRIYARRPLSGGLRRSEDAARLQQGAVGNVGPLEALSAETCSSSNRKAKR